MPANQPLHWLGGFIADLPTPFDDDDRIDWQAFEMLCEHQIRSGATAIVVGETMGEASTLSREEHEEIISAAANIARGRIAVIAGAGSNSTSQAMELTMEAEAAGADAVLSVVPYYNNPMQAGILAHFRAIAGSTSLPIILHDVPARTIREMSDETIVQLSESKQFIGLKDSAGSVARLFRLKSALPPAFRLLSGNDTTTMAYLARWLHFDDCQPLSGPVPGHLRELRDQPHAGFDGPVVAHRDIRRGAFGGFFGSRTEIRDELAGLHEACGAVASCRTR